MRNPFRGTCEETARLMSDLVDGELRGLTKLRVARHVLVCQICRPIYETLRVTVDALHRQATREPPPNPDLAGDVISRIKAGDAPKD